MSKPTFDDLINEIRVDVERRDYSEYNVTEIRKDNGSVVKNPQKIAKLLNKKFTTDGELQFKKCYGVYPPEYVFNATNQIDANVPVISEAEFKKYHDILSNYPLYFTENVRMYKLTQGYFKDVVYLVNESLKLNEYPPELKQSRILPILKYKKDGFWLQNFNELRNSSIFTYIYNYIIQRKLHDIYEFQQYQYYRCQVNEINKWLNFGFYTIDYVMHVNNERLNNLNHVVNVRVVLQAKAISTSLLYENLKTKPIPLYLLNIFGSFLHGWRQYVQLNNGVKSLEAVVDSTIPQVPFLTNDLISVFLDDLKLEAAIFMYAFDINLVYANSSTKNLELTINNDLKKLHEWVRLKKLVVDYQETEYLVFKPSKNCLDIQINKHPIRRTNKTKILGVDVDDEMNFSKFSRLNPEINSHKFHKLFVYNEESFDKWRAQCLLLYNIERNKVKMKMDISGYHVNDEYDPVMLAKKAYEKIPEEEKTSYSRLMSFIRIHYISTL